MGKHQIPFASGLSVFALIVSIGVVGIFAGIVNLVNRTSVAGRALKPESF